MEQERRYKAIVVFVWSRAGYDGFRGWSDFERTYTRRCVPLSVSVVFVNDVDRSDVGFVLTFHRSKRKLSTKKVSKSKGTLSF